VELEHAVRHEVNVPTEQKRCIPCIRIEPNAQNLHCKHTQLNTQDATSESNSYLRASQLTKLDEFPSSSRGNERGMHPHLAHETISSSKMILENPLLPSSDPKTTTHSSVVAGEEALDVTFALHCAKYERYGNLFQ